MKRLIFVFVVVLSTVFVSYAQEISKEDEDQYQLALEYSDNGNANKAIAIYGQLLEKYPGNSTSNSVQSTGAVTSWIQQ